ncbi:MAG: hypothetical protein A4C66_10080 [Nitrospira sp. HN-bin3]|jgi:hypothetical protein|uniref:hypothetical protein n=1 Tax=Nitrospira cf. moscoviensis SBR1015 TaxID=96242 RepID=UPI000A099DBE|nr:hypothetical protein [Nitrospira cf. moscoviensis SBR1015]MBH0207435.1 hypothetical protein [Nitrospira sp.]OQW41316.1 MAG: hypothetical protein A4C66_10080 [Nitrospira sp. HN-bin3]
MFKIKRKVEKPKRTVLYNIVEDYSEFDAPGNVTVCAMTEPEDLPAHARILSESYGVPLETMSMLLTTGGTYVYQDIGGILTRGLFACRIDPTREGIKYTWTLDLVQFAEAEHLVRSRALSLVEAAWEVHGKALPGELQAKLQQKNLGLDYRTLDRAVAKGGDIKYIDFRKDWSPHFKRLCIMPDGRLVETGGVQDFAQLHGITVAQAQALIQQGGTLEVNDEVLACQIVNGQPAVARFSAMNYAKAKDLVSSKGLHMMDALSEVGYADPAMMRGLARKTLRA